MTRCFVTNLLCSGRASLPQWSDSHQDSYAHWLASMQNITLQEASRRAHVNLNSRFTNDFFGFESELSFSRREREKNQAPKCLRKQDDNSTLYSNEKLVNLVGAPSAKGESVKRISSQIQSRPAANGKSIQRDGPTLSPSSKARLSNELEMRILSGARRVRSKTTTIKARYLILALSSHLGGDRKEAMQVHEQINGCR